MKILIFLPPYLLYSPMLCQTLTANLPITFPQPYGAYILHNSDLYFSFTPIISIRACDFLLFRGIQTMPIIWHLIISVNLTYKNIQATVQEFLLTMCLFLVAPLPEMQFGSDCLRLRTAGLRLQWTLAWTNSSLKTSIMWEFCFAEHSTYPHSQSKRAIVSAISRETARRPFSTRSTLLPTTTMGTCISLDSRI